MPTYKTKTKTVQAVQLTKANFNSILTNLENRPNVEDISLSISFKTIDDSGSVTKRTGINLNEGQFATLEPSGKIEVFSPEEFNNYFELNT